MIAELNDKLAKQKMKIYADKRRHATNSNFRVGDRVIYHQLNSKINNKYKNQFSNTPYIIKAVKGSMITVVDSNNNELTRNSSFFKQISSNLKLNDKINEIDEIPTKSKTSIINESSIPQLNNNETVIQTNNYINNHHQQITETTAIENNNNNTTTNQQIITTSNNPISHINTRPVRANRNKLPKYLSEFIVRRNGK